MNNKEIQDILDELHTVRPEMLDEKGKMLFEAIMKIADERDLYFSIIKEVREKIKEFCWDYEYETYSNMTSNEVKELVEILDKENIDVKN